MTVKKVSLKRGYHDLFYCGSHKARNRKAKVPTYVSPYSRDAQPLLTWDLLLHFPVSGDLPICQNFVEIKQTEPVLVGLSVYLSQLHIQLTLT